jgi:hypothetical protein
MQALVKSEVGVVEGKQIAIAVVGQLSDAEELLLARIRAAKPAAIRAFGVSGAPYESYPLERVGEGAVSMLVFGDAEVAGISLGDLTAGMSQKVVLDSVDDRRFEDALDAGVRRELFFGDQVRQRQAELKAAEKQALFRTIWIAAISMFVTVIGVSNALLMSVTERFREIGTMKCLGALSAFIRTLFLIESSLIGVVGSVVGVIAGATLPLLVYGFLYGFPTVLGALDYGLLGLAAMGSACSGTILSILAAIYPARVASNMVPAAALRSTV